MAVTLELMVGRVGLTRPVQPVANIANDHQTQTQHNTSNERPPVKTAGITTRRCRHRHRTDTRLR